MGWLAYLFFSLNGRLKRLTYALALLGFVISSVVIEESLRALLNMPEPEIPSDAPLQDYFRFDNLSILISLISIWPALALDVKRFHDINLSGWFALLGIIPLWTVLTLGAVEVERLEENFVSQIILVMLACFLGYLLWLLFTKGTSGRNRFGPEPD
jgi:uncharacterized membrane protein YhaH (DUF805 family)